MSFSDQLRRVVRGASLAGSPGEPEGLSPHARKEDVAGVLGGEWREWHGHPYLVIERTYTPGHRHGGVTVADSAPGDAGWPVLSVLEPAFAADGKRVLFVDLETTGLAGGAGTYAFLVGCGWFDGATFRIRQLLLSAFAAERGVLQELVDVGHTAGAVATYNGKTFDLPLIEMRFLFHRLETPFAGMPHIDMLHPARRLWADAPSCRLSSVEQAVLGHEREGDVPGFEIPSRYFHYVRTGDARPLEGVLEHNRLDLLSLAMLTARAARLLEQGAGAARTAREAVGLGGLYERRAMIPDARECFLRGADMGLPSDVLVRGEALHAYAVLCRRARQYDDAAEAWRRILNLQPLVPHLAEEARHALAIHYEHRRREFQVAKEFALQSLELNAVPAKLQAVHYRLARLDRKLARSSLL